MHKGRGKELAGHAGLEGKVGQASRKSGRELGSSAHLWLLSFLRSGGTGACGRPGSSVSLLAQDRVCVTGAGPGQHPEKMKANSWNNRASPW